MNVADTTGDFAAGSPKASKNELEHFETRPSPEDEKDSRLDDLKHELIMLRRLQKKSKTTPKEMYSQLIQLKEEEIKKNYPYSDANDLHFQSFQTNDDNQIQIPPEKFKNCGVLDTIRADLIRKTCIVLYRSQLNV